MSAAPRTTVERRNDGIEFTRLFRHPPARVFAAFADPARLALWWGPPTCPVIDSAMDFRVGGIWHYRLVFRATGQEAWSRAVFEEILTNRRIVFVETSSDASGAVTPERAPAHTTVTLLPAAEGTLLTVDIRHSSPDETRSALARGTERGLGSALDQLDALLGRGTERSHE